MRCEVLYPQIDILWLLTDKEFRFSPIQTTISFFKVLNINDEKLIYDGLKSFGSEILGFSTFGVTIKLTRFKVCCNYGVF